MEIIKMTKQELILKVKDMGYYSTPGHSENYLSKDLGNGWVVDLQWWGANQKPNVIATHKNLGAGEHVSYDANHKNIVKTQIDGIKVNKRYVCLIEGTSFSFKLVPMALETIERRLEK
jgi:hypothetical protein